MSPMISVPDISHEETASAAPATSAKLSRGEGGPADPSWSLASDNGIQLIGEGEEAVGGVFPSLLAVYEQQGYRQGYHRAVHDLLASLVSTTEEFIRARSASPRSAPADAADLRRLLYQFGQHLERRVQSLVPEAGSGYVSDGLGI